MSRTGSAKWLLLAASGVLAWQGWVALRGSAAGVRHAVMTEELLLVGPAVLVLVAVVVAAERRWPAVRRPLGAAGHRLDAAYLGLYVLVAVPAVALLGTGFAVSLFRLAPWLVVRPLAPAPRWALVVLTLIVMDGCNWAAHYANHRIRTFWRFHALHHSQEELSILTSFRAHPLVHASFQVAALPLIVLGTSGAVPYPVLVAYVVVSTLPHANLNWGFGPVGRVIVSPAYHRLHHDRADIRGVNLGTVLVIWDQLAGRAVMPRRGATPVPTGLAGRPVPVEQALVGQRLWGGLPLLVRQLCEPLRREALAPEAVPSPAMTWSANELVGAGASGA
jgi:sterol desaturase/sphingolipid hydroxylase (fatty acid hydroxylase superfamily)